MNWFTLLLVMATGLVTSCAAAQDADENEVKLLGKVSLPNGEPLAEVRVGISTAAPKTGPGIFCPSCYLDCKKSTTTNAKGEFSLSGLSDQLKFRLIASAPGHKTIRTKLVDPATGSVDLTLKKSAEITDLTRVVSGVITDSSGTPVSGALVEPWGGKSAKKRWMGTVKDVEAVVTDAEGRFNILLPESMLALDIKVTQYGYCGEQLLLLEPGKPPLKVQMRLGARVTGRLVDKGKPAGGLSLAVVQLERGSRDGIFIKAVGSTTDKDGRFEFRNLPPDQRYCIYSVVGEASRASIKAASPKVITVKRFKVPGTGKAKDLGDLETDQPVSIRGKIRHVTGESLPKDLKLIFDREPAWDLISVPVAPDGTFAVTGLPPETYEIKVGSRELVIDHGATDRQLLSPTSVGVHADESITDLIIPVRGK